MLFRKCISRRKKETRVKYSKTETWKKTVTSHPIPNQVTNSYYLTNSTVKSMFYQKTSWKRLFHPGGLTVCGGLMSTQKQLATKNAHIKRVNYKTEVTHALRIQKGETDVGFKARFREGGKTKSTLTSLKWTDKVLQEGERNGENRPGKEPVRWCSGAYAE